MFFSASFCGRIEALAAYLSELGIFPLQEFYFRAIVEGLFPLGPFRPVMSLKAKLPTPLLAFELDPRPFCCSPRHFVYSSQLQSLQFPSPSFRYFTGTNRPSVFPRIPYWPLPVTPFRCSPKTLLMSHGVLPQIPTPPPSSSSLAVHALPTSKRLMLLILR